MLRPKKMRFFSPFLLSLILVAPYTFFSLSIVIGWSDPQLGIYCSMVLFVALLMLIAFFKLLKVFIHQSITVKSKKIVFCSAALLCLIYINFSLSWKSYNEYYVLEMAADPSTSPEKLADLEGLTTKFSYRLDNLLAKNPSSPRQLLDTLSKKSDQTQTLILLASNENVSLDTLNFMNASVYTQNPSSYKAFIWSLKGNPRIVRKEYIIQATESDRINILPAKDKVGNY